MEKIHSIHLLVNPFQGHVEDKGERKRKAGKQCGQATGQSQRLTYKQQFLFRKTADLNF